MPLVRKSGLPISAFARAQYTRRTEKSVTAHGAHDDFISSAKTAILPQRARLTWLRRATSMTALRAAKPAHSDLPDSGFGHRGLPIRSHGRRTYLRMNNLRAVMRHETS